MKTKVIKDYCYEGLGFPVQLKNIECIELDGEWHPKIDVKKVADSAIEALAYQKNKITGNQVRFIRSYFSMPLRKFGEEVVHESHTAVDKWEKSKDQVTSMNDNTEYVLRLYLIEKIQSKTKKQKDEFFVKYKQIRDFFTSPKKHSFNNPLYIEKYA